MFFGEYLDEHGNPVERTPITNPYSYDGFVTWKNDSKPNNTVYSDRLYQWDSKKYNENCKKHFGNEGQVFYDREPEKIEIFLRDYLDNDSLILCRIMQYCHQARGYPIWRFDYKE